MPFEYRVWAMSPMWDGEVDERAYPPLTLTHAASVALTEARVPPPYRGGTKKEYTDSLTRFFLHYDNKLLSPANAHALAAWLRDWAAQPGRDEREAAAGERAASWLDRNADEGWYLDWSV